MVRNQNPPTSKTTRKKRRSFIALLNLKTFLLFVIRFRSRSVPRENAVCRCFYFNELILLESVALRLQASAINPPPGCAKPKYRPCFQAQSRRERPCRVRDLVLQAGARASASAAWRFAPARRAEPRSARSSVRQAQSPRRPGQCGCRQSASCAGLTAGASVALHFKDQRRHHHCHRRRIAHENLVHPSPLRLNHRRMHDRVQLLQPSPLKGQLGQPRPIQPAIRSPQPPPQRLEQFRRYTFCPGSISVRPSSSASITSAPSSRNICATVLLPLPRPPVDPTRSIGLESPAASWRRARCSPSAWRWSADPRRPVQVCTPRPVRRPWDARRRQSSIRAWQRSPRASHRPQRTGRTPRAS